MNSFYLILFLLLTPNLVLGGNRMHYGICQEGDNNVLCIARCQGDSCQGGICSGGNPNICMCFGCP